MFNLDQAIAEWRQQMFAAGIKNPRTLDELEGHLRAEIEQRTRSGLNEQGAFDLSVEQMGHPKRLGNEFKKAESKIMKRIMMVLLGIVGVLFGAAFVLPALAWYRDHGAMPAEHLGYLLLGMVIAIGGMGATLFGFKRRRA